MVIIGKAFCSLEEDVEREPVTKLRQAEVTGEVRGRSDEYSNNGKFANQ